MFALCCRLICSHSKQGASLLVGSLVCTQKTAKNGLSKASALSILVSNLENNGDRRVSHRGGGGGGGGIALTASVPCPLFSGPGLSADDGFEVDNLPVETYRGSDRQIATAVVSFCVCVCARARMSSLTRVS